MTTAIELRIDPRERAVGAGRVHRLLPHRTKRMVGPFVFADVIGPEELSAGTGIAVNAHPHIGLSTVSYLFDGRMVHRDSTGAVQTIEPGAVNWMTAGSGVTHTERSHPKDLQRTASMYGIQTWVALPDSAEDSEPAFQHVAATATATEAIGNSTLRLAAGSGWGLTSPVPGSSPLVLAELHLAADSPVPIDVGHSEVAIIAFDNGITLGHDELTAGQLAVLRTDRDLILQGSGRVVVLGGEPVGPRHIWWNFVHSDPERIEQAKADWAAQSFPTTPDDHLPYVALPSSI
ncbi:MAG: redox-sensitive bicupin YhaK (pirin superfamily) [Ilumatobacter sp.]|jgi:redox-sensitive bicupin YhaK (pirin superfamily)